MKKTGELAMIESIRSRAGQSGGALRLGIGDDCAILQPPAGHEVLVTTDFSLEGRHFRRDWHPAASVGHRCLARGLSDLAAMGARPTAAFLSLALPQGFTGNPVGRRWMDGFIDGLLSLAKQMRTPLAGGDTAAAPENSILADIVLLGSVPRGTSLRRSGARPGDALYVTGSLGGASAELKLLADKPSRFVRATPLGDHPHLYPKPRLAQGERLRSNGLARAAIDLSDGLSTDLKHLCDKSRVGAVITAEALPIHPLLASASASEQLQAALHGGEDYELLFTARPGIRIPKSIAGVKLTRIGEVTRERKLLLQQDGATKPLIAGGWEHAL